MTEAIEQITERRFSSIPQAARFLQVSERVVRKLIRDGLLQAYKVGRCIKIADLQLVAFLKNATLNGNAC